MLCGVIILTYMTQFLRALLIVPVAIVIRLNEALPAAVVSFSVFGFSADNSCRMNPHVHKDFPFAKRFLRNFINDYDLCDVSKLTVQLRNALVHLHTLFLILK